MKKFILLIIAFSLFGFAKAQDISKSQVPSLVLNNFKSEFAKATDIEWEMDGKRYRVDFEMPWNIDHEVWYDALGEKIKHRIEIEKKDLPTAVMSKISSDFKGYRIEEAEKMIKGKKVHYEVELDAFMKQEWKVMIDENGKILNKVAD